jgi:anaerobic selenocysteine-containing dehydrogenase
MIQRGTDPLTGARRDDVLISGKDMERLSVSEGDSVRLESPNGAFEGRLRCAPIRPGNLEVYWPEGNILLSGSAIDPDSMEPDYNAG